MPSPSSAYVFFLLLFVFDLITKYTIENKRNYYAESGFGFPHDSKLILIKEREKLSKFASK